MSSNYVVTYAKGDATPKTIDKSLKKETSCGAFCHR